MYRAIPILALFLAITACRSNPEPAFQEDLRGTCWRLVSIDGAKALPDVEVTLCFEETDRINGSGGCNKFFASTSFEGERLSIAELGSTRMACAPHVNDQEMLYFQQLSDVRRWELTDGELQLHGEEPPAMKFERWEP